MVHLYSLWWVGVYVAGLEISFYLFCCLNCLIYRQLTGMPVSAKEKRQRLVMSSGLSKLYLSLATIQILLYLWHTGLRVAKHTFRYSSARVRQLKTSGRCLWQQKQLRGAVLYPWKGSWRLVKAVENHLWNQLKCSKQRMRSSPFGRAGCRVWSYAKSASRLGTAVSGLRYCSKYGKSEPRSSALGRSMSSSDYFRRQLMSRKSMPCLNGHLPHLKRNVSWGELVHLTDDRCNTVLKQYNHRMSLYRKMPLKLISRLWGRFNQLELPTWLRRPAFRLYIWLFGCRLEDAAIQDLTKYRNLSEFFRRNLRPGIRPIDSMQILTSPADGKVLHCGEVANGMVEQVKGVSYSLVGFLGPFQTLFPGADQDVMESYDFTDYQYLLSNQLNKLYHCIIYLAPGDYHKFHSPADWSVFLRRYFPGELFSVNPGIARWLQGLFNFNERAVYVGNWEHGFFSMAAVGATNVGSINVCFDKTLTTNAHSAWPCGHYADEHFTSDSTSAMGSIRLKKGELFGDFNLGSTIVLLFEAPDSFEFAVRPGQRLRYGQGIGTTTDD